MWPDNETPEPAAWINFNAATSERNVSFVCESELASIPLWPEPPREQRQPLTEGEIDEIIYSMAESDRANDLFTFARAIEKAHGVGD